MIPEDQKNILRLCLRISSCQVTWQFNCAVVYILEYKLEYVDTSNLLSTVHIITMEKLELKFRPVIDKIKRLKHHSGSLCLRYAPPV